MSGKSVALLIVAYNNQAGLEKSIRSIQGEDKDLVDIVVVDDGSSPPLHLDNLHDYAVTLIKHEMNQGCWAAANTGLQCVLDKGYTYIARLDCADTLVAGRFRKQITFLQNHEDVGIVGTWVQTVSPDGMPQFLLKHPTDDSDIRKKMHLNSCFCHPSVMMRSSVLKAVGLHRADCKSSEDYDLFFRILTVSKGANLPEILLNYEVLNPTSISYKKRYQQLFSRLRIQLIYFNPLVLNSYVGIIKTLITFMLPYRVLHVIKKCLRRAA